MDELSLRLDKIVAEVAGAKNLKPDMQLTALYPAVGAKSKAELMIVGRAVNGGDVPWRPAEMQDGNKRQEVIEKLAHPTWSINGCPMAWIVPGWNPRDFVCTQCKKRFGTAVPECDVCHTRTVGPAYRCCTSAFFRTMRQLGRLLQVPKLEEADWPSYLIWSNLYKVAPYSGGNPSNRLCSVQEPLCIEMLKTEIALWKPKHVVFLTGDNWAKPFREALGADKSAVSSKWVSFAGRLQGMDTKVVVGPHPQGKPETVLCQEIATAFEGL